MLQAKCTRCGETFIPFSLDPEELIHGITEAGKDCGGIGIIEGEWIAPGQVAVHLTEEGKGLTFLSPMEEHGLKMPDCDDPDCEFHHPEVCEPAVTLILNDGC